MYSDADDNTNTYHDMTFPPQVYTMRHVPFPYFFVSNACKIQMANTFAVRMAGYSLTELVNQPLALLVDDYAVDQLVMMRATQPDESFVISTVIRTKEGQELDAEVRVTIDYQDNYGIRGYHLFVHPVETRYQASDNNIEAVQKKYNEQIHKQSAMMFDLINALKTPLSTLNTSAYLIQHKHETDEREKYTTMLQSRISHIVDVLQNVYDYQHISQHNPAMEAVPVSLNAILKEMHDLMRYPIEGKGLRFMKQLPVVPVQIMGHHSLLTRLFSIILQNAIDYTDTGHINLTTYIDYERHLVHVMVQDSGCGIPNNDLLHVCDSFYRAENAHDIQPNGGGMGLTIVQKIVEQHHGTLTIESTLGQGTSVIVTLPVSQA